MRGTQRKYTNRDKALVYVTLEANDGNLKRTAIETGVPRSTVRFWRDEWETNGVDRAIIESLEEASDNFIEQAEAVKLMALNRMKEVIPKTTNLQHLATTIGILDDKAARAKNLPAHQDNNVSALPSPEEVRALFSGYITGVLSSAQERHDIIEAEIVSENEQSIKELSQGG